MIVCIFKFHRDVTAVNGLDDRGVDAVSGLNQDPAVSGLDWDFPFTQLLVWDLAVDAASGLDDRAVAAVLD